MQEKKIMYSHQNIEQVALKKPFATCRVSIGSMASDCKSHWTCGLPIGFPHVDPKTLDMAPLSFLSRTATVSDRHFLPCHWSMSCVSIVFQFIGLVTLKAWLSLSRQGQWSIKGICNPQPHISHARWVAPSFWGWIHTFTVEFSRTVKWHDCKRTGHIYRVLIGFLNIQRLPPKTVKVSSSSWE